LDTSTVAPNKKPYAQFLNRNGTVFVTLWLVTFILYVPAAKAGWVIDSAGWLHNIRTLKFWDYINNAQSGIPSLYQFTQFTTYLFYKAFNANPYAWHTLMVTMHATNAFLFFMICRKLFDDSGVKNGRQMAFAAVVLYCVCPHISEVIVWEAAFHYLQGFLLILLIIYWVQKYQHSQQMKYAVAAAITYFCSSYSLEIFYLTPWFVLALAVYYRLALGYDKHIFRKTLRLFFVPQLVIFVLHIIVLRMWYHGQIAHIGEHTWQPFSSYICKAPRYIFHLLFFGRFFPQDVRMQVYQAIGSTQSLIIFYNIFVLICFGIVSRIAKMSAKGRMAVLMFVWVMISIVIIMPLEFPVIQMVQYDRYSYFLDAFIYMLLVLLVSYIPGRITGILFLSLLGLANVYFTVKENLIWKHATYVDNRLLREFPDPGNKTVVLLNLPQNMEGVPMIGAEADGQFKMMYELFIGKKLPNKVYDAAAFNMISKVDGAHVKVVNDSMIQVVLNQWGTWWWYESMGARSYENDDYKLDMKSYGNMYELTLKHPAKDYLLLYSIAGQWKPVDWNNKQDQY
jgi:hypothetical protein